jgi:CPA2 family monovalent cation:H+ antiporter-2
VSIGLTQIGEFSYILVRVARNTGMVGNDMYNSALAASLITILLNAVLVRYVPAALARRHLAEEMARHATAAPEPAKLSKHVVICGFGRVGSGIGTALGTFGVPYTVVDLKSEIISELQSRGVPCIFGDPSHPHILERAGVAGASLVIVTLPNIESARLAVMHARRTNPHVPIMGRAHGRIDHEVLLRAGATEVIQPEMEASATMIRHAWAHLGLSDATIREYLRGFRGAMDTLQAKPRVSRSPWIEDKEVMLEDGPLVGNSLRDAQIRERFGVMVLAITRATGQVLLNPTADTVLKKNDRLRVVGSPQEIDFFEQELAGR